MTWQSIDVLFDTEEHVSRLESEHNPKRQLPYPDWHSSALCVGQAESVFFGARDTSLRPALSMSDVNRAKAICARCPVFERCLSTALGVSGPREEYGIWAGTSGRTRRRIWELVEGGSTTINKVIEDVMSGNGGKYERKIMLTGVVPIALRKAAS